MFTQHAEAFSQQISRIASTPAHRSGGESIGCATDAFHTQASVMQLRRPDIPLRCSLIRCLEPNLVLPAVPLLNKSGQTETTILCRGVHTLVMHMGYVSDPRQTCVSDFR